MARILIADDHQVVAEGIARIIKEHSSDVEMDIAGNLADALLLVKKLHPDLLLLDVALPDGDGIDAIPLFVEACPPMRIIIFTMYAEGAVVGRAMKAGAHGYLLKSVSSKELLEAIHAVANGETYICEEARSHAHEEMEAVPTLTLREREVLALIVQGKTIKEIAEELFLGFETVHSYTKYLRQKLHCQNTASLVRTAIEQHLV